MSRAISHSLRILVEAHKVGIMGTTPSSGLLIDDPHGLLSDDDNIIISELVAKLEEFGAELSVVTVSGYAAITAPAFPKAPG